MPWGFLVEEVHGTNRYGQSTLVPVAEPLDMNSAERREAVRHDAMILVELAREMMGLAPSDAHKPEEAYAREMGMVGSNAEFAGPLLLEHFHLPLLARDPDGQISQALQGAPSFEEIKNNEPLRHFERRRFVLLAMVWLLGGKRTCRYWILTVVEARLLQGIRDRDFLDPSTLMYKVHKAITTVLHGDRTVQWFTSGESCIGSRGPKRDSWVFLCRAALFQAECTARAISSELTD